jgi:hypothetical protein
VHVSNYTFHAIPSGAFRQGFPLANKQTSVEGSLANIQTLVFRLCGAMAFKLFTLFSSVYQELVFFVFILTCMDINSCRRKESISLAGLPAAQMMAKLSLPEGAHQWHYSLTQYSKARKSNQVELIKMIVLFY